MEDRLDLAVIESRWWEKSNDSVRGVFDMLAGLHRDNPFAYHYEMFNDGDSLREVVRRIANQRDIHNLYIAAHGTEDGKAIKAAGGTISRTSLRNTLRGINALKLHGLFVGACFFGLQTEGIIEKTGLTWLAGYRDGIDWIHSSAMDLYFWNAYFQSTVPEATTKIDRVERMCLLLGTLYYRVPYMFNELGFQVTLAPIKGAFATFPSDGWEDLHVVNWEGCWGDVARDFIDHNPGEWP